jgi:DNA-directed RNA polymerase specialized sigma24 family protein
VLAAVGQLPRRQRECITLRYYFNSSDADIATTLGLSIGSVKKHLHRANTSLAVSLEALR